MKLLALITFAFLGASSLAEPTVVPASNPAPSPSQATVATMKDIVTAAPPPQADSNAPWSIAGQWQGVHGSDWSDTLTFNPDGTFQRGSGDGGKWSITCPRGQVLLMLAWDNWPAEYAAMIGPDLFRGDGLEMRRIGPVNVQPSGSGIETVTWRQGEPPVRIMPKDEGFCCLSLVTGHFQGGGEVVRVYVGADGYWYLGGQSGQEGVAAQCLVIRYAKLMRSMGPPDALSSDQ